MKFAFVVKVFALVIPLGSCRSESQTYIDINHPNLLVTRSSLIHTGFSPMTCEGVDELIIGKYVSDTLIYYQFQNTLNDERPVSMFKVFEVPKKDSVDFMSKETLVGLNITCHQESNSMLVKKNNNLYYRYSFSGDGSDGMLIINIQVDIPKTGKR